MTFITSGGQMAALSRLARRLGVTKTAALRQAVLLLDAVASRHREGYRLAWIDKDGHPKEEIVVLGFDDDGGRGKQ